MAGPRTGLIALRMEPCDGDRREPGGSRPLLPMATSLHHGRWTDRQHGASGPASGRRSALDTGRAGGADDLSTAGRFGGTRSPAASRSGRPTGSLTRIATGTLVWHTGRRRRQDSPDTVVDVRRGRRLGEPVGRCSRTGRASCIDQLGVACQSLCSAGFTTVRPRLRETVRMRLARVEQRGSRSHGRMVGRDPRGLYRYPKLDRFEDLARARRQPSTRRTTAWPR